MNDEVSQSGPTRVCYYMQTHTRPAQIARLVNRIKDDSPNAIVLIDHDASVAPLDASMFQSLSDVHVINGPGGYGDFSHLDRYFRAVDWLDDHDVEFDWLQNLTGQDYPLRPIEDIEKAVATSAFDGYIQYAPVFPERTPADADWGARPAISAVQPLRHGLAFRLRAPMVWPANSRQAALASSRYDHQSDSAMDSGEPGLLYCWNSSEEYHIQRQLHLLRRFVLLYSLSSLRALCTRLCPSEPRRGQVLPYHARAR